MTFSNIKNMFKKNLQHTDKTSAAEDKQLFVSVMALLSSLLIMLVVFAYLGKVKNTIDIVHIKRQYFLPLKNFRPEKPEQYRYMILTLLFPCLFCFFFFLFRRIQSNNWISKLCIVTYPLGFITGATLFYFLNKLHNYIIIENYCYKNPAATIIMSVLLLVLCFALQNHIPKRAIYRFTNIFFAAVCGIMAVYMAAMYITGTYCISDPTMYNFEAYYYPVYKVFSGYSPGIDFFNIYGFYPYIITPLLILTGGVSILRFSILIAAIFLLALIAMLIVIWINVKNKILAACGFASLLFFVVILPIIESKGFYLQYQPHRVLFPALILAITCLHSRSRVNRTKRFYFIAGFALCAVSLVWNLDTGVVSTAAFMLYHIYTAAYHYDFKQKSFYLKLGEAIAAGCISVLAALSFLEAVTYFRSGKWLDINNGLMGQNTFYGSGYYMLPMKFWHPWLFIVFIYAAGLIKSLREIGALKIAGAKAEPVRNSAYFTLSVVGMGIFSYYQGRSADEVLTAVIWPALLMGIIMTQEGIERISGYIEVYRTTGNLPKMKFYTDTAKSVLSIILIASFALSTPYLLNTNHVLKVLSHRTQQKDNTLTMDRINFLRRFTEKGEKVDLFAQNSDYYYTKLGVKDPMPISSYLDWFTRVQYNQTLCFISDTRDYVIFDDLLYNRLDQYSKSEFERILKTKYRRSAKSFGMTLYVPVRKSIN